jgi:hypothetical protein
VTALPLTRGIVTGSGTGGVTSQPVSYMALRSGASDELFSDARFGAFGVGTGLANSTEVDQFTANLKTLWEALAGQTLP